MGDESRGRSACIVYRYQGEYGAFGQGRFFIRLDVQGGLDAQGTSQLFSRAEIEELEEAAIKHLRDQGKNVRVLYATNVFWLRK